MSRSLRRGTTGEPASVEGRIERFRIAEGSKSEHAALGVATDDGGFVVVHVVGDTPFAEETLAAAEGRRARANGVWRNGKVRVERDAFALIEDAESAPAVHTSDVAAPAIDGSPASDPHSVANSESTDSQPTPGVTRDGNDPAERAS